MGALHKLVINSPSELHVRIQRSSVKHLWILALGSLLSTVFVESFI